MQLSRTTVLLLCAAVVMMTSIGMSSFSLFLPCIEAEFGWSRAMATVPYMVVMSLILFASGFLVYSVRHLDTRMPEPVLAMSPSRP